MKRRVEVIYDGKVLRPQQALDLELNARYRVTIEIPDRVHRRTRDCISALAQDLGVEDLAEQHDHYIYGTPKR